MARIVVSSCGASAQNGTTQINYTVGEAVVSYLSSNGSPTYKLSQGYQQSDTVAGSGSTGKVETTKSYVHVSPNPASQFIRVRCFTEMPTEIIYNIYNSFGQLCLSVNNGLVLRDQNEQTIDLSKLAAGSYILQVSSVGSGYYFVKNLPLIIVH